MRTKLGLPETETGRGFSQNKKKRKLVRELSIEAGKPKNYNNKSLNDPGYNKYGS